ncbi:DegT/DnrJ/EryC1/StrS family aminotransferase [candidate division KSB1 bacterium]
MSGIESVPYFNIDKIYKDHKEEILASIDKVFSHGQVLMGKEIDEFEEKMALRCDRKYAVALSSCTDALYFSLIAAGVSKGDEVLVTSFSFIASVTPILMVGAIPVFVDIDRDNFMMDYSDLQNKITSKTKSIIAVHLFGQCLDIEKLENIAGNANLILIEDAAQSFCSSFNERKAGSMGICSCISFDPTKVMGAFGNGGIALTNDKHIYNELKMIRYHGKNFDTGEHERIGHNSRIATSQAALLNLQLNWIDDWIISRRNIARKYSEMLGDISEIELPAVNSESNHIFHKFVIKADRRDELKVFLSENNVKTMIHYGKPIYENVLFNEYDYIAENINTVGKVTGNVISLPIYPELTTDEINFVCDHIRKFYTK